MKRAERAERKRVAIDERDFLSIRPVLGYNEVFNAFIGGRERGKSYAVEAHCIRRTKYHGDRFIWMRISPQSTRKMLANNGELMFDAKLVRDYKLDISVKSNVVYDHGKKFCEVYALAEMAKWKGVALFDSDDDRNVNIVLDEFNIESGKGGEKRTQDVVYNFLNMLENLVRSRKTGIRVFLVANHLEECSDLLLAFGFLPEQHGIFHLASKRAVIWSIPNGKAYLARRKDTLADLLGGNRYSTFSNALGVDLTRIWKGRLFRPTTIIVFPDNVKYTIWDDKTICEWHGEKTKDVIAMSPYLDYEFIPELRDNVIMLFDSRSFCFRSVFVQKTFKKDLMRIKPRK